MQNSRLPTPSHDDQRPLPWQEEAFGVSLVDLANCPRSSESSAPNIYSPNQTGQVQQIIHSEPTQPLAGTKSAAVSRVMKKVGDEEDEARQGSSWSDIRLAAEELYLFKAAAVAHKLQNIPTSSFLAASNLLLHVLDKIGPRLLVLRQDVERNTQRVETAFMADPEVNSNLMEIVKKEAAEGTARTADSCSRAILWLSRSISFSVTLMQNLEKNPVLSLEQVVEETYNEILKPWHGWISSAAYKVAIKLVPEREVFMRLLMGQEQEDYESLKQDIKMFVSSILPVLDETYALLRTFGLDKLKAT